MCYDICIYLLRLEEQQHGTGDERRGEPDDGRDGQVAAFTHPRLQRLHNCHIPAGKVRETRPLIMKPKWLAVSRLRLPLRTHLTSIALSTYS